MHGSGERHVSDVSRFVRAQDAGGVFERAMAEVAAGRKRSHWMWFVYPQLVGLGFSGMAARYAISGLPEARAALADPELGPRLLRAFEVAAAAPGTSVEAVFGGVDTLKLRSSATLFLRAAPEHPQFQAVLDRWFGGEADAATDRILARGVAA